jgi:hypothetical protein
VRVAVLIVALAFLILFAALTLTVISQHGLDVLSVAALVILAMMGFGIVGALRHPPEE